MLPVSQDFLDSAKAMAADFRAKLEITWTDPYIDQSITTITNGRSSISWVDQVADSIEGASFKWAACDNLSMLDGTYHLCPDTEELAFSYQLGWWGDKLAGADGQFSSPYPTLTVAFENRPIFGLKVVGDDMRGEYPVDFDIRVYDGTSLVHTEQVTNNSSVVWLSEASINSATRMVLEIHRWSHEARQVKITEFFTSVQVLYFSDDIASLSIIEEREFSTGSLPIGNITSNELSLKLNNIDDRFTEGNEASPFPPLAKANRKIKAWLGLRLPDGIIEYVPMGVFWTGDWNQNDGEVTISTNARDRMEMLRRTTFKSDIYQNKTLYELAEIILIDAKDAVRGIGEAFRYWIDDELKEYAVPWAYFKQVSHREALRQIVEACCGQAYADRNGIIRVEGPSFITRE
jgi:hypothetical protein